MIMKKNHVFIIIYLCIKYIIYIRYVHLNIKPPRMTSSMNRSHGYVRFNYLFLIIL